MPVCKWTSFCRLFVLVAVGNFFSENANGQQYEYVYRDLSDSTVNCYLKVLPDKQPIRALIIRDYSTLPDTSRQSPYQLADLAAANQVMTIYTVTSDFFPEMYYTDSCMYLLDEIVSEVLAEHTIPEDNIFMGGISASGTRALRYAQFCAMGKSHHNHRVKGVFAVDSPLDLARFYYSVSRHKHYFKAGMLWEAELMETVFREKLGGSPADFPTAYLNASVFSADDSLGGNAHYLADTHLLLYHEPDLGWWMEERGSTYFDMNSFDIAAFVLKLQSLGSTKVELVTTTGKGFDRNGDRNCHSWSIVDEEGLMQWILDRIEP